MTILEFVGQRRDAAGNRVLYHVPAARLALVVYNWTEDDEFTGATIHIAGAGYVEVSVESPDSIAETIAKAELAGAGCAHAFLVPSID